VSRAEIMEVGGQWPEALHEAGSAAQRYLESLGPRATGEARYCQAEIQRLRGDLVAAEDSYREAHQHGREPHRFAARSTACKPWARHTLQRKLE
jgi:hypothetical protein